MKQKLCAAFLCVALTLGLMTTAMATPVYNTDPAQIKNYMSGADYYLGEDGDMYFKYDAFTENWLATHPGALERDFGDGRTRAGLMSGFSEGLALVVLKKPSGEDGIVDYRVGDGKWAYMNLNGDILDLDPVRYDVYGNMMQINKYNDPIWTFMPATVLKDGIAWASWQTYPDAYVTVMHQGFVNAAGQRVLDIPHSQGFFSCDLSGIMGTDVGFSLFPRFVNGYTIIANGVSATLNAGIWEVHWREDRHGDGQSEFWFSEYAPEGSQYFDENNLPHGVSSTYSVIDEKGNVVEIIHGLEALEKHPLTQVALITSSGVPYGYLKAVAQRGKPTTGTGSEQPLVLPTPPTTYGQSTYKSLGYTIVGNIGYLNIEVSNSGDSHDMGDLFYVLYNKYAEDEDSLRDTGTFVPADYLLQIHYELDPGESEVLRVGVGQVSNIDRELTETELAHGWFNADYILDSRYVLCQAETQVETYELTELFKELHFYNEMQLDYQADTNGVTVLAKPLGSVEEAKLLNKMLYRFTTQF